MDQQPRAHNNDTDQRPGQLREEAGLVDFGKDGYREALTVPLETFPDACIVQTHRDPVKVIASVSSLVLSLRRMMEPGVAAQLRQWTQQNPQTQDGEHVYAADDFGLLASQINEAFAACKNHFQL